MPNEATVDEIMEVYVDGWRLGLKAVAIYRDGSKRTQPLNTAQISKEEKQALESSGITLEELEAAKRAPHRNRLPATRPSLTHKFDVAGHEGYLTVGLFEDGRPGELFVSMAKEGSTVGGMMDVFATGVSLCLQYGVPLEALVKKFTHQRFEPSGMTSNRNIPFAKSIVDYIFRWLQQTFLDDGKDATSKATDSSTSKPSSPGKKPDSSANAAPEAVKDDASSEPGRAQQASRTDARRPVGALLGDSYAPGSKGGSGTNGGGHGTSTTATATAAQTAVRLTPAKVGRIDTQFSHFQEDAPPCPTCGSITVRNGNCYKCFNCGSSLGCS
jgi:ribonucleoside-diphosphate reductase alpha chain